MNDERVIKELIRIGRPYEPDCAAGKFERTDHDWAAVVRSSGARPPCASAGPDSRSMLCFRTSESLRFRLRSPGSRRPGRVEAARQLLGKDFHVRLAEDADVFAGHFMDVYTSGGDPTPAELTVDFAQRGVEQ